MARREALHELMAETVFLDQCPPWVMAFSLEATMAAVMVYGLKLSECRAGIASLPLKMVPHLWHVYAAAFKQEWLDKYVHPEFHDEIKALVGCIIGAVRMGRRTTDYSTAASWGNGFYMLQVDGHYYEIVEAVYYKNPVKNSHLPYDSQPTFFYTYDLPSLKQALASAMREGTVGVPNGMEGAFKEVGFEPLVAEPQRDAAENAAIVNDNEVEDQKDAGEEVGVGGEEVGVGGEEVGVGGEEVGVGGEEVAVGGEELVQELGAEEKEAAEVPAEIDEEKAHKDDVAFVHALVQKIAICRQNRRVGVAYVGANGRGPNGQPCKKKGRRRKKTRGKARRKYKGGVEEKRKKMVKAVTQKFEEHTADRKRLVKNEVRRFYQP